MVHWYIDTMEIPPLKQLMTLAFMGAVAALQGCDDARAAHTSHGAHPEVEAQRGHEPSQAERSRPTNQVAVVTVWAEAEKVEPTARFYEDVLELRRVGSSTSPYILDTDGTFVVIMEGKLEHPRDPKRRWPLFALTVPDIDRSVEALVGASVELPWGIEEFGEPEPSSRYVMFRDPAGNLVELVQWLK